MSDQHHNLALARVVDSEASVAPNCEFPHYAIEVRHRHERTVERWLRLQGLSPFLPALKNARQWSDRVVEIEIPLFPRYVFCPIDLKNRLPILTAPGVLGIVGAG